MGKFKKSWYFSLKFVYKKVGCYNVVSYGYCWLVWCVCNMVLGNVLDIYYLLIVGGFLLVRYVVNG